MSQSSLNDYFMRECGSDQRKRDKFEDLEHIVTPAPNQQLNIEEHIYVH